MFKSGTVRVVLPHRDATLSRATQFLRQQAALRDFPSFISDDSDFRARRASPTELFTPMLVLNAFSDCGLEAPDQERQLQRIEGAFTPEGFVHFFADRSLLAADVDCTSVALDLMHRYGRTLAFDVHATLDALAGNVDSSGVLRVYLNSDPSRRERLDAAVCVNALYLFYLLGRENDLEASEEYVWQHLNGAAFVGGTRYYPSPDVFLGFLSRLVRDFERPRARFAAKVAERVRERLGLRSNVIELSARIAAAESVGVLAEHELAWLLDAQNGDGSWPAAPCFRFGRKESYFGGESVSTAWAVRALMAVASELGARHDLAQTRASLSDELRTRGSEAPKAKRSA
jgi:hypothetical protein